MQTEQEWIVNLELEIAERTTKKDLCQKFDVEWSENLRKLSIEQLREQIELRREIANKYGQRLRGEHFDKSLGEYERYIANVAIRTMTIPGKYSMKKASLVLGVPVEYLNKLRLKKIISCERIERSNFFYLDVLKIELLSPAAQKFFAERKFEYRG